MKISVIHAYNTNAKKERETVFRAKVATTPALGMDILTIKALTDKKVKAAYEKFLKFYTKEEQEDIPKAFSSCLNADGTLSKYALDTFNALYKGVFPDFWTNIKHTFKNEMLNGFTQADKASSELIIKLANIIESCKDKNNNLNKDNLLFAQELFLKTEIEKEELPDIISALKDQDGVCSKENIEFFDVILQNYSKWEAPNLLKSMLNNENFLTDSAKNFVLKLDSHKEYYIFDILNNTKNAENRDEILDFISESDYLKEHTPSITYYKDKDGNINLDYLKKYIELNQDSDEKKGFYIPTGIYQSKDETILNQNIQQIKRLIDKGFDNKRIASFANSCYFKTGEAVNSEFVDYILNRVDYMFRNPDRSLAFKYLDSSISNAKEKNGIINWDIAEILHNFAYKFNQRKNGCDKNQIINMQKQLSELCRDEQGNFSEEKTTEAKKDVHYLVNNFDTMESVIEANNYLEGKYLADIIGDKNIYNPVEMLNVLNKIELTDKILYTKIPEYGNLLFAITEIPPEKDPNAYKTILKKIDAIKELDFNIKDSHNVSFLEKVIISENMALLKLISHPSKIKLRYYPELDLVYKNIQNRRFKRIIDNDLYLSFPLLEEAAKLGSLDGFRKLESQLDSNFMRDRKKELLKLEKLINQSNNEELQTHFRNKYSDEIQG